LRLARLNYKEDPDGRLVIENVKNDRTEQYINFAMKALSNVENLEA
jgi:hypothetical protein